MTRCNTCIATGSVVKRVTTHNSQVPEPGMALIFELGEEIERRVAGRSHHEGLQLVTPHGVAEQPDRVVDGEEDKQQIWKHRADRGDEARAPIGARDARDRHPPSPPAPCPSQSVGPRKAQAIWPRLIAPPQPLCYSLGGPSGGPSAAHFQAVDAEAPIPEFEGPGTRPRLKSARPGGKALVRGR